MQADLNYIDTVMDRAVAAEAVKPRLTDAARERATKAGQKIIAGLRVRDENAENDALDKMIVARRSAVEKFRSDRAALRERLGKVGVTALAICPIGAWREMCSLAGLFVLKPNAQSRVAIDWSGLKAFADEHNSEPERPRSGGGWSPFAMTRQGGWSSAPSGGARYRWLDTHAEANWPEFLRRVLTPHESSHSMWATLILPDPPADVVATLIKVQGLDLQVAAVAEAIRFSEKPSELIEQSPAMRRDRWAQAQGYEDYADWIKRDPIVFTEHESAVGVVAQFGDFPIERDVVDAAAQSDKLFAEEPDEVGVLREWSGFGRSIVQLSDGRLIYTGGHIQDDREIDLRGWRLDH